MIGEPPHDAPSEIVRGEREFLSVEHIGPDGVDAALEHGAEGAPEGLGDLFVGAEARVALDDVDVGADDHADAPPTRHGLHVVEAADEPAELAGDEAELFEGLALGGVDEVGIARLLAAAGEGHVPGPRIARALGPPDEEDLGLAAVLAEERGHGGVAIDVGRAIDGAQALEAARHLVQAGRDGELGVRTGHVHEYRNDFGESEWPTACRRGCPEWSRMRYKDPMKNALVTGGCGFLGSSIVRALLDRGVKVRILALPSEPTKNVDGLDVEIVHGNVLSPQDCLKAVEGMDTVFHAAAIYKAWMPDPTAMYEVNDMGTFHMLEACRRAGVEKVVYTASIVAIGRPPEGTLADERTPYDAWDIDFPYSRAKYHSRRIADAFAMWGLDVRIVCPGIVFGPRDIGPTPSGKLILETLKGEAPPIYVDGGATYVDVRDAAEVHVLAAERGKAGETYVATAHNLDNIGLLRAIGRVVGKERKYVRVPVPVARALIQLGEVQAKKTGVEPQLSRVFFEYSLKPSFYSNEKSVRELGASYRPIEETIRDAIAWFRENGYVS